MIIINYSQAKLNHTSFKEQPEKSKNSIGYDLVCSQYLEDMFSMPIQET